LFWEYQFVMDALMMVAQVVSAQVAWRDNEQTWLLDAPSTCGHVVLACSECDGVPALRASQNVTPRVPCL
jgi:hypothetical protein